MGKSLHLAFVGSSGSGKTTLIESLAPVLRAQGLRVALVKHTHHRVELDEPGKDSWRFGRVASGSALVTPERVFIQSPLPPVGAEDFVASKVDDFDLVIHEGGFQNPYPKLLVGQSVAEARSRLKGGPVLAVVDALDPDLPSFGRDDVAGVAGFVAGLLAEPLSPAVGETFDALLDRSAAAHGHTCPGQVLGVRIAVRACRELGVSIPPPGHRLVVIVETDRCAADAIGTVTGCSIGRRTLRHADYGKMAATFVDTLTRRAVRVVARDDARDRVRDYVCDTSDLHAAQAAAYRAMPDSALLRSHEVELSSTAFGPEGMRAPRETCAACGEDVTDGREVRSSGAVLCRACSGESYYRPL